MTEIGEPHPVTLSIAKFDNHRVGNGESDERKRCCLASSAIVRGSRKGNSHLHCASLSLSLLRAGGHFLFKYTNLRNSQRGRSGSKKGTFALNYASHIYVPGFSGVAETATVRNGGEWHGWGRKYAESFHRECSIRKREARESNIAEQATWATIAADYPFLIKAFVALGQKPITATTFQTTAD